MIYDVNGNVVAAGQSALESGKKWKDNGVYNALCVAKQFCTIPWTTTNSGMPNGRSGTLAKGQTVVGLPYSSASVEDGYIGIGVTLYTFMTALHNPRSVLYTEESKGYTGFAYYGTVCTSLVCAAWGLPCLITTVAFPKTDIVVSKAKSEIQLGDMLLSGSHAKLITGIVRDSNGTITNVQVSESTYDHCIENSYQTYSAFLSSHTAYTVYRYKKIDDADSYVPSPFFSLADEETQSFDYPDIMTAFGDRVSRKKGTDIPINVLSSDGYSSISVYKNGVLTETKSTLADFTISAPDVGVYEVRMTGNGGKASSTFFDIVDATLSVSENTLTFTTTYAATAVGGFPTYTVNSSGKATSWNNPKRVHFLTEDENIARSVDITAMRNDSDCNGGVRLYVKGVYGSVSFELKYT